MRKQAIVLYVMLVIVLPMLLCSLVSITDQRKNNVNSIQESLEIRSYDTEEIIYVYDNGIILEIPLDEYVAGVVLAEMPADFELEALKAQAVACRTFTLKSMQRSKHEDAYVCTDPACCQAFISSSEYEGSISNLEKIYIAIKQTEDEILMFQGNLIEATYFSCSGGQTEAAAAVWGADVPYLQSVDSPGEEISSKYETTESFSHTYFKQVLDLPQNMKLDESNIKMTYTVGGGVDTLSICDFSYSGVQVRSFLDLHSTIFDMIITNDSVLITTKGYGHRVGMSQYGAEAMAVGGSSYDEILLHYYLGTDLVKLSQEEMNEIFDKAANIL